MLVSILFARWQHNNAFFLDEPPTHPVPIKAICKSSSSKKARANISHCKIIAAWPCSGGSRENTMSS